MKALVMQFHAFNDIFISVKIFNLLDCAGLWVCILNVFTQIFIILFNGYPCF